MAGFWSRDGRPARTLCEQMLGAQSIYGPMKPAIWSSDEVALGARLHPVLADANSHSEASIRCDGGLTLVADMRLDNRQSLEKSLGREDFEREGLSDPELVLQLFQAKGIAVLKEIVGDFALAIWDVAKRRLILARDPLGQRPLFYATGSGWAAFSSMPCGLHALPSMPRQVDEAQLQRFLFAQPEVTEDTFFRGVRRVLPGHGVVIDSAGVRSVRLWDPNLKPLRCKDSDDYVKGMREKLDLAVARRIRGTDRVIGTQLSAGLDSSATASTAARLLKMQDRRLIAFTGVPSPKFRDPNVSGQIPDESGLAGLTVARYDNMEHVTVSGESVSPLRSLELSNELYERPIPNLANMPWLIAVNDAVKSRGVSILLTGQGGNWSISHNGYEVLPYLFSRFRWFRLAKLARQLHIQGLSWRPLLAAAILPSVPKWIRTAARWRKPRHSGPLRISAASEPDIPRHKHSALARLQLIQRLDLGSYNKATLAGWGIDLRDPTSDVELIEYCLRIPIEQYIFNGVPRSLALRTLSDRVPPEVLREKRRGLQGADWHLNFSQAIPEIKREIAKFSRHNRLSGWVDFDRIDEMLTSWEVGASANGELHQDFRGVLLRVLSTGCFLASGTSDDAPRCASYLEC